MDMADFKEMFEQNKHYFRCIASGYLSSQDYNGFFCIANFDKIHVRSVVHSEKCNVSIFIDSFYDDGEIVTILKQI